MKTICAMLLIVSLSCSQAPKPNIGRLPEQKKEQSRYDFYNLLTGAIAGMFIFQWVNE